jgi:cell surface protein SprA
MFAHAEPLDQANFPLDSTNMKIFIRMGSDFINNYYEYELPLYPSDALKLNGNPDSRDYKEEVWRPENAFDFPLELFTDVKKERNANTSWQISSPFITADPEKSGAKVKVVGNPNLGYVKGIMIGVRNTDPEKQDQCVEVWLNELRLNGFNEKGGYAGQARMDIKLADFGNVSLAGNYSSIGWGSIEEKLAQRQREEVIQYDVSTNLELGKLLPEKSGLKLPFYAQYSNITRNPEYDPYDLDIKLKDKVRDEADPVVKQEIKDMAQDVTIVRGYNFTNVRKERKGKARKVPLPWNVENFSVTYAYNQQKIRTPFIQNGEQNQYKGALDWQYSTGMKPFKPFKKLIKNDKYLKFVSDFNLNPLPENYGFSSNLERLAAITTYRFAGEDASLNTYYNRRFTWDRNYDLGWTIAQSLRFNVDATARSIIDEPLQFEGGQEVTTAERRNVLWNNFKTLGRPKSYTHSASLNWTLPFKSIPFMDWVSMKASYTAGYTWTAQSLKLQNLDAGTFQDRVNERSLGNVIQNNNIRQINGDYNLEQLYNKSKYLQKINKPAKGGKNDKGKGNKNDDINAEDDDGGNDNGAPAGNGAGGKNPTGGGKGKNSSKVPVGKGKESLSQNSADKNAPNPGNKDNNDPNAGGAGSIGGAGGTPSGGADASGGPGGKDAAKTGANNPAGNGSITDRKGKDGKQVKDNKERQPSMAERIALRPLMLVRKARFNYTENFSTIVPGFTPDTKLMGLSESFDAPGWEFVAGMQPSDSWLDDAGRNGWITHRPELNQQVMRNYTQNFDAGVTIEPFPDFRVEVTANKQYARNSTELYKDQIFNISPDSVGFQHRAQRDLGSYTVSYFSLQTLFDNDINRIFSRYEEYRPIVSKRLGIEANDLAEHETDKGYVKGFGKIQQQVLIPAFVAAYTDANPNTIGLDIFKTLPSVNWKLNYNGLNKLGNLKNIFSSVQISHGYKNTLTVNSYNTDLFFDAAKPYTIDALNYNYVARYEIPQVVINEQFQPLFGLDVKFKNEMTLKADFKKTRSLAMSFIDYQLAESRSTSYSAGFGYRMKNVNIPFLTGKKKGQAAKKKSSKSKKAAPPTVPGSTGGSGNAGNDLTFKFDFEVRDDITTNHLLDSPNQAIPTRGSRTVSINPAVEYALNKRLKLRLFTDYRKTVPKTSQSFPITTLNSGITIQFSLN